MTSATLTAEQWELLRDLVRRELADLPMEIRHTDTPQFRLDLQQRRQMLEHLLEQLPAPAAQIT